MGKVGNSRSVSHDSSPVDPRGKLAGETSEKGSWCSHFESLWPSKSKLLLNQNKGGREGDRQTAVRKCMLMILLGQGRQGYDDIVPKTLVTGGCHLVIPFLKHTNKQTDKQKHKKNFI